MGTATKVIITTLIIFNIFLASFWVIHGNIFFHTDIARDFLLMEDIVDNRHLTLIGPRSGAIPGLFHGPLWLYLNLPSFLISGGNPVFVGWFWAVLYIVSLLIVYYVGKKIFNRESGLLSVLLLSSITILNVRTLFNPYGALILFPLFFFYFLNYLQNKKIRFLILSLFLLGLIIQFQIAFGVPILLLTTFFLIYFLAKNKKISHLLSFFILVIPLSSYFLFELRNNFLQTRSVLSYVSGEQTHGKLDLNLMQLIVVRIREMFLDGFGTITQNNSYITLLLLLIILVAFFKISKQKNQRKEVYVLFVYFYLGFWLMTIFFKGSLWNYYYLPFIPLLTLLFVSFKNVLNKWFFYTIFFLIYFINIQTAIKEVLLYETDVSKQDVSTWKFNQLVAKTVFAGNESEFGYFIFTPDLYGYSPRYALNFVQKKLGKKSYPFSKKKITYLVIAPPPEYGKDPNSIWYQKNTNSSIWKSNDLRITRNPDTIISFNNGFIIEKYNLSDEEMKIEPNPFLIKDIFFR